MPARRPCRAVLLERAILAPPRTMTKCLICHRDIPICYDGDAFCGWCKRSIRQKIAELKAKPAPAHEQSRRVTSNQANYKPLIHKAVLDGIY